MKKEWNASPAVSVHCYCRSFEKKKWKKKASKCNFEKQMSFLRMTRKALDLAAAVTRKVFCWAQCAHNACIQRWLKEKMYPRANCKHSRGDLTTYLPTHFKCAGEIERAKKRI